MRALPILVTLLAGVSTTLFAGPIYNVSAYVAVDAGGAHDFVNRELEGVATTGLITMAVNDNAGGGAQSASLIAYSSVGALGFHGQAFSTGTLLHGGQSAGDLNWFSDFTVTGTPGTTVSYLFSSGLDGVFLGSGQSFGGVVTSTAFVGGTILANYAFNTLTTPGPFSVLTSSIYTFNVGQTISIGGRMTGFARAEFYAQMDTNALSTSRFYVDTLTPGGGYFTDTGTVFATLASVPEPGTWSFCIASFGLLAFYRIRRSSR